MTLHSAALTGYSREAGKYETGRPDYPPALLPWLGETLGLGPQGPVLDLGAGTGKFTRLLVSAGVPAAHITAVEPVPAMAERLAAALPTVRTLAGSAEALPLPDGAVTVVTCAQSFHWFANPQALREIHRVLQPGGRLGLIWNVREERVDWVAAITALITPYEGDAPRFHTGAWRRPFESPDCPFGPLQVRHFAHVHRGPFEEVVVNRIRSVSFIAALPAAEQARVVAALRALPSQYPALQAPEIAFPYRTEAWHCQRREG